MFGTDTDLLLSYEKYEQRNELLTKLNLDGCPNLI